MVDPHGLGYPFFLAGVGRVGEAVQFYRRAARTDPLATLQMFQFSLDCARRYDEADVEFARTSALPLDPAIPSWFAVLRAMARGGPDEVKSRMGRYLALGDEYLPVLPEIFARLDEPEAALDVVRGAVEDRFYQGSAGRMNGLAYLAAWLGDDPLALDTLKRCFLDLNGIPVCSIWHPVFTSVSRSAGFKDLVRGLGLHDYWRASGHWGDFARPIGEDDFEIIR